MGLYPGGFSPRADAHAWVEKCSGLESGRIMKKFCLRDYRFVCFRIRLVFKAYIYFLAARGRFCRTSNLPLMILHNFLIFFL